MQSNTIHTRLHVIDEEKLKEGSDVWVQNTRVEAHIFCPILISPSSNLICILHMYI